MRGFRGPGTPGQAGQIRFGYLADGTPAATDGQQTWPVSDALVQSAQSNAQRMTQGIPSQAGGGNVQGRGLYFTYQTPNVAALAPGGAATVSIQFDQNSVFNWLRTTYSVDLTNAAITQTTEPLPYVTVQITDTGNGMSFMNGPIPLYKIAGTAELPYVLPTPQLIQANAAYQYQYASFSTAGGGNQTYDNLRLQFHGYRIFNIGQSGTG